MGAPQRGHGHERVGVEADRRCGDRWSWRDGQDRACRCEIGGAAPRREQADVFLNVGVGPVRTGVFNVADVAIMLGAGVIVIATFGKKQASSPPPRAGDTA